MESGREPCPYRILDDVGGAFAMGMLYHIVVCVCVCFFNHSLKTSQKHIENSRLRKTTQVRSEELFGTQSRVQEILHPVQDYKELFSRLRVEPRS